MSAGTVITGLSSARATSGTSRAREAVARRARPHASLRHLDEQEEDHGRDEAHRAHDAELLTARFERARRAVPRHGPRGRQGEREQEERKAEPGKQQERPRAGGGRAGVLDRQNGLRPLAAVCRRQLLRAAAARARAARAAFLLARACRSAGVGWTTAGGATGAGATGAGATGWGAGGVKTGGGGGGLDFGGGSGFGPGGGSAPKAGTLNTRTPRISNAAATTLPCSRPPHPRAMWHMMPTSYPAIQPGETPGLS